LNGSLVVNGVAVIGNAQKITLTTADSTHTATITGTDWAGSPISETVALNGSAVTSVLSYKTVTQISVNAALTAAITVGTSGIGSSPWVRLDEWAGDTLSIQCDVSGTANYTVQSTLDDPNSIANPVLPQNMNWVNSPDANAVNASTTIQTGYGTLLAYAAMIPLFVRVVLNSGTGSVTMTAMQMSAVPY
jgi:hypothetical protein